MEELQRSFQEPIKLLARKSIVIKLSKLHQIFSSVASTCDALKNRYWRL